YVDVAFDPSKVAVNGEITHGPIYINGVSGDTTTPGLINNAGGFFDIFGQCESFLCFGDGDVELLFSVPFVATSAGAVTFDVQGPNEPPPIFDALMFGLNEAIPLQDIDFVDATLQITQPTATDLLRTLVSNLKSMEIE